jgi:hypothetical protein
MELKDTIIPKFEDESDLIYNYRLDYIRKEYDNLNLKVLIKNSKILANMKFKNCRYHPKIYNSLKKFI